MTHAVHRPAWRPALLAVLLAAAACGLPSGSDKPKQGTVSTSTAPAPTAVTGAAAAATPASAPTPPPAPVSLTGTFDHRNAHDTISGGATLTRTADGKLALKLTDVNSTGGPALYVYVSHVESPNTEAQLMDGLEVARLKSLHGDQDYGIESGADPREFKSVVVYCRQFKVIFGYANLK